MGASRNRLIYAVGGAACAAVAAVGMLVNATTSNAYEPVVPPCSTHPQVTSPPTGSLAQNASPPPTGVRHAQDRPHRS